MGQLNILRVAVVLPGVLPEVAHTAVLPLTITKLASWGIVPAPIATGDFATTSYISKPLVALCQSKKREPLCRAEIGPFVFCGPGRATTPSAVKVRSVP